MCKFFLLYYLFYETIMISIIYLYGYLFVYTIYLIGKFCPILVYF